VPSIAKSVSIGPVNLYVCLHVDLCLFARQHSLKHMFKLHKVSSCACRLSFSDYRAIYINVPYFAYVCGLPSDLSPAMHSSTAGVVQALYMVWHGALKMTDLKMTDLKINDQTLAKSRTWKCRIWKRRTKWHDMKWKTCKCGIWKCRTYKWQTWKWRTKLYKNQMRGIA